jgi:RimJ/RimL family protein N-acetyltransferase
MLGNTPTLEFKPIDLDRHADLCIQFREDSYICSFGSVDRFHAGEGGAAGYLRWLQQRMKDLPNSCVHVWLGDTIIGQIELGRWRYDPKVGYVNLFYLVPAYRGQGLGEQLDAYAARFFQRLGCIRVRLSASPTNTAAMQFYRKNNWQDLGMRQDSPEVHYLEKHYNAE